MITLATDPIPSRIFCFFLRAPFLFLFFFYVVEAVVEATLRTATFVINPPLHELDLFLQGGRSGREAYRRDIVLADFFPLEGPCVRVGGSSLFSS